MHKDIFSLFDAYSLRARLMPGLLAILPLPLAFVAWFPTELKTLGALLGFMGLFGGAIVLAQIARDRGKKLQTKLFKAWGGCPSTTILRHRSTYLNLHTKRRYHETLNSLLGVVSIPSEEEEREDPDFADSVYESASDYLRERTRSKEEFPLLLAENVNFGTRRNLLGLKPLGISIVLLSFFASSTILYLRFPHEIAFPGSVALADLLLLSFWCIRASEDWVKTTAFSYAERLLASCEVLEFKTTKI